MPWLWGLATVALVLADPKLAVNKWSGCGEVTSSSPVDFFEPCATAEWEVLMDAENSQLTTKLKMPEAENLLGCREHKLDFGGSIVLLQRGGCYFSWKARLAEAANAGAVLIFDTAPVQVTAILAVPGPFENPRIPGYLISRSQGEELLARLDDGKEIQIICSWSPVNVWVNLPEYSRESNDSIILQNHGDADMPWVVDMIDNNASFETDPFYAAHIFVPDTLNASEDVAIFNISEQLDDDFRLVDLPFRFPHYLEFKDKVFVSANGVLVFDRVFSNVVGSIADAVAPAALIAPLWADLFGGTLSARGDMQRFVLDLQGFWMKPKGLSTKPFGPFTFQVVLWNDGEIHIYWEDFPSNKSWQKLVEIGLEPGSGAKALKLNIPFGQNGRGIGVALLPWVKLSRTSDVVSPNESVKLNMTFQPNANPFAWLFFYAKKSVGSWHPRRNVRVVQRTFRHSWVLSAWDGGLHSGACAKGFLRSRKRTCVGSDGVSYDDSYCAGSCSDISLYNFDYPLKHVWRDGYNNRCEDYRALSFCNETGYGPKWQTWWGTFEDWVSHDYAAGQACCVCGGGKIFEPVVSEPCPSVNCPVNSEGVNVLLGCSCTAGYNGSVRRSEEFPFYQGACSPVPCPSHSFGWHIAAGCTCDEGYVGSILPSKTEPFFTGGCEETTTTSTYTQTISITSMTTSTATKTLSTKATNTLTSFTRTSPTASTTSQTATSSTFAISTMSVQAIFVQTFQGRDMTFPNSSTSATISSTISLTSSATHTSSPNSELSQKEANSTDSLTTLSVLTSTDLKFSTTSTSLPSTSPTSTLFKSSTFTTSGPTASEFELSNMSTTSGSSMAFGSPSRTTFSQTGDAEFASSTLSTSSQSSSVSRSTTTDGLDVQQIQLPGNEAAFAETPKFADTSTSHKVHQVAAMATQGPKDSGPSASALILVLLVFMPFVACFCGAGRRMLPCKAKAEPVHPISPQATEAQGWTAPNPPDTESVAVTVRAAVRQ